MTFLFVDANIPIYAGGRPHPLKAPSLEVLGLIARHPRAFLTDAEVFQELLHRYLSLRQWPDPGLSVIEGFELLMRGRIEPVSGVDVLDAARAADVASGRSARDLLHLVVARRVGAFAIVSADRGFDGLPDIQRLDPADVAVWKDRVSAE